MAKFIDKVKDSIISSKFFSERIDYYVSQSVTNKLQSGKIKDKKTTEFGDMEGADTAVYDDASYMGHAFFKNKIEKKYQSLEDLIRDYRRVAQFSYVNDAIEEIVNEAIVLAEEETVKLKFKDKNKDKIPKKVRETLVEEFDNVKTVMDFDNEGDVFFKNWYIDGRIYIQQIIEVDKPKKGIVGVKQMSPFELKRIYDKKEKKHFYIYEKKDDNEQPLHTKDKVLKVPEELVAYCHSGLINQDLNVPVSHLHFALRDINRLDVLEDHILIYRIVRAPERRAFYIDVGNLPQAKAKEYVKEIMNQYRNKKIFNATTGKIEDSIDQFAMLEDFFLIRRNGKGTEIDTLSGGENLGELEDLMYFERRVYRALKVPQNRMKKEEAPSVDFSRQSEIERDELKFAKFVSKLRKRFSVLFFNLLENQCSLKGLVKREEFKKYKPYMYFDYMTDSWWEEAREWEKLRSQLEVLGDAEGYVGTWLSKEEVQKKILKRTDEEIKELKKQLKKEAKEEAGDDDSGGAEDFDFGNPEDDENDKEEIGNEKPIDKDKEKE